MMLGAGALATSISGFAGDHPFVSGPIFLGVSLLFFGAGKLMAPKEELPSLDAPHAPKWQLMMAEPKQAKEGSLGEDMAAR